MCVSKNVRTDKGGKNVCLYDLICLVLVIVGSLMCVYQFALNDFDFDKTMFEEDNDDDDYQ